jgi:hypothetical protein
MELPEQLAVAADLAQHQVEDQFHTTKVAFGVGGAGLGRQ